MKPYAAPACRDDRMVQAAFLHGLELGVQLGLDKGGQLLVEEREQQRVRRERMVGKLRRRLRKGRSA